MGGILYQPLALVGYFSGKRSWSPSGQFSENTSGQRSKRRGRHMIRLWKKQRNKHHVSKVYDFLVMF